MVLQCVATIQKEHRKFCLAAEGLGNRLCYLESTSEAKVENTIPVNMFTDIAFTVFLVLSLKPVLLRPAASDAACKSISLLMRLLFYSRHV